jgi:hypothetical protein
MLKDLFYCLIISVLAKLHKNMRKQINRDLIAPSCVVENRMILYQHHQPRFFFIYAATKIDYHFTN